MSKVASSTDDGVLLCSPSVQSLQYLLERQLKIDV